MKNPQTDKGLEKRARKLAETWFGPFENPRREMLTSEFYCFAQRERAKAFRAGDRLAAALQHHTLCYPAIKGDPIVCVCENKEILKAWNDLSK